jgi:glutamate synthase (NADPH/NADH) small chain
LGNGKVTGVKFIRTEEKNGKLSNITGSEFIVECDWVIKATGQSKQKELFSSINGIVMDEKGRIVVNENFQSGNPKYFAAGDAVSGGLEVVNAAADGKKAAQAIERALIR